MRDQKNALDRRSMRADMASIAFEHDGYSLARRSAAMGKRANKLARRQIEAEHRSNKSRSNFGVCWGIGICADDEE